MDARNQLASLDASCLWQLVEERVFSYECDFQEGTDRSLEAYLPEGDAAIRKTALIELVKVDMELQWKRGSQTSLQHYCDRYRDLGSVDDLPPDLVYEAYLIARQHGVVPELKQFCAAYPRQRPAVMALAQRTYAQSTSITRQKPRGEWNVGTRRDDFLLLAMLGEGAFGKVFLAEQVSLARHVALKVTANIGSEARTMASLEHDNIVQVFSETIVPDLDARLLCMQYVPGTTLGKVIRHLAATPSGEHASGRRILELIDDLSTVPAVFQAAGFQQRQTLEASDRIATVALLGSQLAGALAYAHQRGVLHRDIKPDNILVSQYGRPLLVDFNLALDPRQLAETCAGMFGGSLRYMAPEHLDALNPMDATPQEAVDQRSDIYSLGVVLFELLHLKRPFDEPVRGNDQFETLREMAQQRRARSPVHSAPQHDTLHALEEVVERCLNPDPAARYQSAGDLRTALEATRELHEIHKGLPPSGRLLTVAQRRPLLILVMAVLVPSLLGSIVNISYNLLRIVSSLTPEQMDVFQRLLVAYNLVVYPICTGLLIWLAWPIFFRDQPLESAQLRRRIVALPIWIALIGILGWFPGGIVFPLGLHLLAGPLAPPIFGHFLIDFTLSGLVAVTYAYFGAEAILLRVLYPRSLAGQSRPHLAARSELRHVPRRIRWAQVVAGIIPLVGATLLVVLGPAEMASYGMFRLLVVFLIGLGMVGFCLSLSVAGMLQQTVQALVRPTNPRSGG